MVGEESKVALEWLYFEDWTLGGVGRVRHVRNGGEQKVLTPAEVSFVDGYDSETRTVFEFHSCYYHGCPTCFKKQDPRRNCHLDRTVQEVYEATQRKMEMLRRAGYTVIEKWEYELAEDKKTDQPLQEFLKTVDMVEPLNPRDAFFGGRTGATTLYAKAEEGEEIKYADVTSLYPCVNKYKEYPVGFPLIYTNSSDQNIHHYFGVALVGILALERLYHPVLTVRAGNKLTFPLCGACVEEEQKTHWLERTNLCDHTDAERMLRGTWFTEELKKAAELGYRMIKIHEVWHFKE